MSRFAPIAAAFIAAALMNAQPTPPPAAAAKPAEPPKDKEFADVIKGAERIGGLFTFYRTEDKVFLEIQPDQLDKLYDFSMTCESGVGERGIFAAFMMCGERPISFHKFGKNIQVIARNPMFTAEAGSPIRRSVDRSFASSVLGMTKLESAPHPERKSLLIELGPLLLTDLPMYGYRLEATFRMPYRYDGRNSSFGAVKAFAKNVEIETIAHYAAERPALPPLLAPGAPQPPSVPPPRTLADVRSMLLRFRYSISEPLDTGYRPRIADDRIGHFFTQIEDYSTDTAHRPTKRYISRWHLEKADPSAAISRPKQPIVFWLENSIPVKYRPAIREGVLMWNKAFEAAGFRDAIEARQQPDDADWDPADVRYNTIRWLVATDAAFAIGPSRDNPFTGQKYDSDITFSEGLARVTRSLVANELKPLGMPWDTEALEQPFVAPWSISGQENYCSIADGAYRDGQFGFGALAARGVDPDSPEADKFLHEFLRLISAHEVGHTLGLRHNFRASVIHTLDQNGDPSLTAREGIAASVMDYIPANIAPKGAKQGEYYQAVVGPYDIWAIEYAYKPINATTPEGELPELKKIASRAAEPLLAYATDEDAGFGGVPFDMDPTVSRFDLGADPLDFARRRRAISNEIVANMEAKLLKPGEGYQPLRRAFNAAFGQAGQSMIYASKFIGGIAHHRDHFGDPSGRLPYVPVAAAKQKEALNLLRKEVFGADAYKFTPDLLNKLAIERHSDYFNPSFNPGSRYDVPVHQMALSLQSTILNRLLHPVTMNRILDTEVKVAQPFRLSELFQGLQDEIWAEAQTGKPVNSYRRGLQREHLKRMTAMLLRDGAAPEDARTLARFTLAQLQSRVRAASANPALPVETRAHFSETVARIEESLKAQVQRTAF